MLIDQHLFSLYLVAAAILMLIPGPDTLIVLTRSLAGGRRRGWVAAGGIFCGCMIHSTLAALGVSALITASALAFDALRWVGAVYLAWIGARGVLAARSNWRGGPAPVSAPPLGSARRVYAQAMATNLLNPKVILFFLTFLPQFVVPGVASVGVQMFILGTTFAVMSVAYHCGLAALAAGVGARVMGNGRFRAALDAIAGTLFLGFALRLFVTERRLS